MNTEVPLNIARTTLSVGALLILYLPYCAGAADAPPAPGAAGSTVTPLWLQLADAAQKIATTAGIILGGIAAYYKFLRGRVFKSRLDISMSSSVVRVDQDTFLQTQAQVKNTGSSVITFVLNDSILTVFGTNHAHRGMADESTWGIIATVDAIGERKHKWIEPGETIYLNWLIDLPRDLNHAALKSELYLSARKIIWQADTIATISPTAQPSLSAGDVAATGTSAPRGVRELLAWAFRCLTLRGARK
jgi:hypothetical protein